MTDGVVAWCFECDCFASPTGEGTCGKCGTEVELISDPPRRGPDGEVRRSIKRRRL